MRQLMKAATLESALMLEVRMRWQAIWVVLIGTAAACSGGNSDAGSTTGPPPPPPPVASAPVASVTVQPAPATVLIGATLQLWATTKDAAGNVLSGRTVTWTSSDTTVARVSAGGLVTGVAAGPATITTASEGNQATTPLTAMRLLLTTVAAGVRYTCGVTAERVAFCWGANDQGQLGNGLKTVDGLTGIALEPSAVWGGLSFTTVSVQFAGGCGLAAGGSAFCWGSAGEPTSSGGALGSGRSGPTPPVAIAGGLTFTAVSDADGQACGLTASGVAYCWGWNRYGQLGTGDNTDRKQPAPVTGGLTFTAISAGGDDHTCGLTSAGAAYCWGLNNNGQVGAATSDNCSTPLGGVPIPCGFTPVAVSGGLTFAAISAGYGYTCGLSASGAAYCWGTGSTTPAAVPGGLSFAAITTGSSGSASACGLTTGGAAYCWASNSTTLTAVPGGLSFAAISKGLDHTCGLTTGGVAYCWGSNSLGQLGDGTQNPSSVPVKVFGQP